MSLLGKAQPLEVRPGFLLVWSSSGQMYPHTWDRLTYSFPNAVLMQAVNRLLDDQRVYWKLAPPVLLFCILTKQALIILEAKILAFIPDVVWIPRVDLPTSKIEIFPEHPGA